MKAILTSVIASALSVLASFFLSAKPVGAQSLNPNTPSPLQAGINKGQVDNGVGTHYWYFNGGAGKVRIHCQYSSIATLGPSFKSTATFTLTDGARTWKQTKDLTADTKTSECDFDGDLKKPTKLILTITPPPSGLLHVAGDYQVEATGAVAFSAPSDTDQVVGVYKQMNGYTTLLGDCKFSADGNIETTSGASGNWKLFDKDSRTYVINITGQDRHSLQLVPGRGLCDSDGIAVFQSLR